MSRIRIVSIILVGIMIMFIRLSYAQSERSITWDKVGGCESLSQTGGIKVGGKSYPIKFKNLEFYKEDLFSSGAVMRLRRQKLSESEIMAIVGVGTVAEVFPGQKPNVNEFKAPKGSFLTDENGTRQDYVIVFDGMSPLLAGFFVFKGQFAQWPLSTFKVNESKPQVGFSLVSKGTGEAVRRFPPTSVQIADCVLDTEKDTLYCAWGGKIKSPEWFNLCEIEFRGEIEIMENGIKLSPETELRSK